MHQDTVIAHESGPVAIRPVAAEPPPVFKTPTPDQIEAILRDPLGGGAVALLEDANGDGFAWRRETAPPHLIISHDLEEAVGAVFSPGQPLNRHVARSLDEAMTIMRDRGVYRQHRSPRPHARVGRERRSARRRFRGAPCTP